MKRVSLLFSLFCAVMSFSCTKEDGSKGGTDSGSGSQTLLSGSFALDDGSGLTRRYLSFSNKTCNDFSLKDDLADLVIADGSLWHCKVGDFLIANTGDFSIVDGQLICGGVPYGALTILEDAIMLGEDRFVKFTNFKTAWYTTLSVEAGDTLKYSYWGQEASVPIKLDKSVLGSVLAATVTQGNTWITDCSIDKGNLVLALAENNTGEARKGSILVTCPGAEDLPIIVKQTYTREYDRSAANCYIVSSPGTYSFKTVKGNTIEPVGNITSAEVLWESFGTSTVPSVGDIISSVSYSNGKITYSTPSTLKNGNAVIAAKDADGNILWSWHIWVCAGYDPVATSQEYYNNAGVMMDRNLGATSATPGDVGALGLLYQWGRKDPFLGSSRCTSFNNKAASTNTWSTVVKKSSNGTIDYTVKHPTTFITTGSGRDWYYAENYSLIDITRWQSVKTIYDPCPSGWRVPDGGPDGVWSKAVDNITGFTDYPYDETNRGMYFSGQFGSSSTIWYPFAGGLYDTNGGLMGTGFYGYWWSCTPVYDNSAYIFEIDQINGMVYPCGAGSRALGYSVRCVKE